MHNTSNKFDEVYRNSTHKTAWQIDIVPDFSDFQSLTSTPNATNCLYNNELCEGSVLAETFFEPNMSRNGDMWLFSQMAPMDKAVRSNTYANDDCGYDAPLTVYGKPNNIFVADFVGNPSINFVEAKGAQEDGKISLTLFDGCKAVFTPSEPLDLAAWFAQRDAEIDAKAAALKEKLAQKGYVEKGNKDERFRYHIARVDEIDESLLEEPVLTNEDFVLGIRPEFIEIENGSVEGEIYGAMPTGMESTIKVRLGDYLLTGVVFGSTLFTIGEKVKLGFKGDDILLFDRNSGKRIACGSVELLG